MSTKFKTPNGKATVTVPHHQVQNMENQGFVKVDESSETSKRKASKRIKDTAETKALSEVTPGEDRTR